MITTGLAKEQTRDENIIEIHIRGVDPVITVGQEEEILAVPEATRLLENQGEVAEEGEKTNMVVGSVGTPGDTVLRRE